MHDQIMNTTYLLLVLVLISTFIALYTLVALKRERAGAATSTTENSIETQKAMTETLMALSANLAKSTSDIRQEISERLNEKFTGVSKDLRDELAKNNLSVESKFTALEARVSEKLDNNIKEGFTQFQKVQDLLVGAEKQLGQINHIGESIQELNSVLNLPHLRGKLIGEGSLERLLSDFLPAGFYESQYQIEGALVDFVIKFPHLSLVLPIDSKFNFEQVSALYENSTIVNPDELVKARKRLAEIVKQNAKDIKNKYIKPRAGTTDYALMYLPSETLYFEIVRDSDLWNFMAEMKVFPVSPNTLAITVNSIGKAFQYYEMAKGVQKTIRNIQLTRDHLDDFKKRFEDVGEKLMKAQDSFNKAGSHLSNYSSSVERLISSDEALKISAGPSLDQPVGSS